jgi:hypothetical protein
MVPGELVIHSDRGSPMTSDVFKEAMKSRGVDISYSRPRVSDDNPFSEALFKTAKYGPMYPGVFACLSEVRQFCTLFFSFYNEQHHHSGLNFHTPSDVHHNRSASVAVIWQQTLDDAFAANPSRFGNRAPKAKLPPDRVAINLPCGPVPPPIFSSHPASHEVRPNLAATGGPGSIARPLTQVDPLVPRKSGIGCRSLETVKTPSIGGYIAAAP